MLRPSVCDSVQLVIEIPWNKPNVVNLSNADRLFFIENEPDNLEEVETDISGHLHVKDSLAEPNVFSRAEQVSNEVVSREELVYMLEVELKLLEAVT